MHASSFLLGGALLASPACTSGSVPSGSSNPTAANSGEAWGTPERAATNAGCDRQPDTLAEHNCGEGIFTLWACGTGRPPPADTCTRTTSKDVYCCPGTPPPPRATVEARWTSPGGACAGDAFSLGTFAPSQPINDGASASVECSVTEDGDAFLVSARASVAGTTGSVVVSGRIAAFQPDSIDASFVGSAGRAFGPQKCRVTIPESGGIAEGRLWILLACQSSDKAADFCEMSAQLRFENCKQ